MPAYPTQTHTFPDEADGGNAIDGYWGLTKREYIAALCMQSLVVDTDAPMNHTFADHAKDAVNASDALLEELKKEA